MKEIKDAAAKQADDFKAKLEADQRASIDRLESEKAEAEKRLKALESTPKSDAVQPTFEAARDAAVKAKQEEIEALKAQIDAANNDPVMKAMREAVEDAARSGGKKSSGNKNPDYKKPTAEYDVMMSVVGSCRILMERNRKATPSQVLAGFYDDDHRAAGLKDVAKCRDFLTSILELANA